MKFLAGLLLLTTFTFPAYAIKSLVIKNDRVLIDTEGENVLVGDQLAARTLDGKAKALLEVKQVKNGKAVASIIKGRMQLDFSLSKYAARSKTTGKESKRPAKEKTSGGFTAGYAMNSMTVKPSGAPSVSLSGSSFNLSGFYQVEVDGNVSARLFVSYETLQATGTSPTKACTGSADCKVDISYLGLEALVRYRYLHSKKWDAWAGAGLGFLFAIGKSSNVLDSSKISTNQTVVGSLGLDYQLDRNSFIPVQLDYALFPDNSTSSANQIILRAGYGFNF
ncbi:hypothetical protein [Bdellovibrio sp.]|uniref:hypothetical protein n=1 Tax=Bdellovibrio sp. TaxID=28201 RepID=UPI0039E5D968